MNWYYAAEGKPVGPVDEDDIRSLAREGRVTPDTLVWHDGMEGWKRFTELSESVMKSAEPPPVIDVEPDESGRFVPVAFDPSRALAGETRFGIRDCFARGWDVVASRPWLCIGAMAVYLALYFLTISIGLIGMLIAMPYFAGLNGVFLRISRGQETNWSDLLTPMKRNLINVVLVQLLPAMLFFFLCRPFEKLRTFDLAGQKIPAMTYDFSNPLAIAVLLLVIYLSVSWMFGLLLVVDQSLRFWEAIQLSHRVVTRHFGKMLLFTLLCGIFAMIGVIIFYLGVLLTASIALAAVASAYDSLFSPAGSGAQAPPNQPGGGAPPDSPQG